MKRTVSLLSLAVLVLALGSCQSRTDLSEGSVILSVTDFDKLPVSVSAGGGGPTQVGEITLQNFAKNPNGTTSDLQSIELRSYEVRYSRRDTGTRLPPPMVQSLFSLVPVNGTATITNLQFLTAAQLLNPPLSDLATAGADRETGSQVIVLNVSMRFFGRTLAGDDIASDPASFTVEVVP
ncbi:MAG TPA: hypothetical protein VNM67_09030 [Thermoanaerobaculia bacterium]|jgi:hypothetical protein|nr:hypothetical protein [Thermoanaerobaculia bacterium]